jgi:hypothetical protein
MDKKHRLYLAISLFSISVWVLGTLLKNTYAVWIGGILAGYCLTSFVKD